MKFITFDVTNTLIKVSGSVGYQYNKLFKKFNYDIDVDLANKNFSKYFKELNKKYPSYGSKNAISSQEWWSILVKNVINENSTSKGLRIPSEKDLNQMANYVFDEFTKPSCWTKLNDCDLVLNELKKNSYNLAVVSNFDERLFKILNNLNLANYFHFILIPNLADGHSKPKKEIFQKAFELSKCKSPDLLLHVGDNYDLDYKPAIESNFKSILLVDKNEKEKSIPNDVNYVYNLKDLLIKIKDTF